MDAAPSPGFGLKDVKWSSVSIPLDLLVSTYRLPQVVKLDGDSWTNPCSFLGKVFRSIFPLPPFSSKEVTDPRSPTGFVTKPGLELTISQFLA